MANYSIEKVSEARCFGGTLSQYTHSAGTLDCPMRFAIYLPPEAQTEPVPVLYWLSGLTCSDENFCHKAGAFAYAAEQGIAIVCPDTSPRGEGVADDADGAYDFGLGAGFYLNATQAPWNCHYHMYDYVVQELPAVIEANFPVTQVRSISGHSMGGHGALTIGIKNPQAYRAISAFSPICHPSQCPWGQKAFTGYLGPEQSLWREYDATLLLQERGCNLPILVDQGSDDNFLAEQLMPEALEAAAQAQQVNFTLRMQPGYDHSYYFIASFIAEHINFHAKYLRGE